MVRIRLSLPWRPWSPVLNLRLRLARFIPHPRCRVHKFRYLHGLQRSSTSNPRHPSTSLPRIAVGFAVHLTCVVASNDLPANLPLWPSSARTVYWRFGAYEKRFLGINLFRELFAVTSLPYPLPIHVVFRGAYCLWGNVSISSLVDWCYLLRDSSSLPCSLPLQRLNVLEHDWVANS